MQMTYVRWKRQVDREIEAQLGLSSRDLPDIDYWSYWISHASPLRAAQSAINHAVSQLVAGADQEPTSDSLHPEGL
jgi:hypothetical protein